MSTPPEDPPPEDPPPEDPPPEDPPAEDSSSEVGPAGPPDETAALPPVGDETAVLPPTSPAAPDRWSGRAGIPPARDTDPAPPEAYREDKGRGWWTPAVIGIVALVLLGMLLAGVWLIVNARGDEPTPLPTRSATPTAAPPTSRPAPSSTGAPSPTGAALVEVPRVVGLPVAVAQDLLDQVGLTYQVSERVSDARPGTVVAANPVPGTQVPPRSSVTLLVAVPRPTTAAPKTPAVTTPTTPANG